MAVSSCCPAPDDITAFSNDPEYPCLPAMDAKVAASSPELSVTTRVGDELRGDGVADGDGSCLTSSTVKYEFDRCELSLKGIRWLERRDGAGVESTGSRSPLGLSPSVQIPFPSSRLRKPVSTDIGVIRYTSYQS